MIALAAAAPAVASARVYLVLKHPRSQLGTPLYKPRNLVLSSYYGDDGVVQQTRWTGWGKPTAVGHGVIRGTMGLGAVIGHVTLTATDVRSLFPGHPRGCAPELPATYDNRYRELHARFHWKTSSNPYSNRAARRESRALSGNLAGAPELQC